MNALLFALETLLWTASILLCAPAMFVLLEIIAGLAPAGRTRATCAERPRVCALIPAHNEGAGVEGTIRSVRAQMREGDRVLVVADNCADDTAEHARRGGAEVVERIDPDRRGKGYALAFGLDALASDPPEVVVMIDADCEMQDGSLNALARFAAAGQVAQGVYLMRPPTPASARDAVSTLAVVAKNLSRPRGLSRLGLPVLLTGAGMAFPWRVIRGVDLASGNIVEDMQLGLDLAVAGHPPRLCAEARILADLAAGDDAASSQRRRWEHGHLRTLLTQTPRLVVEGARRGRPSLWALAAEVGVPPLSLLALLLVVGAGAAGIGAALGASVWPLIIALAGIAALLVAAAIAWASDARDLIRGRTLLSAPFYVLWKIPLYLGFARGGERSWVRTPRAERSSGEASS